MCLTKRLARQYDYIPLGKPKYLHDSYIYRSAICMDIPIIYDSRETLNYRQHSNNTVGVNKRSLRRLIKKIKNTDHFLQGLVSDN